MAILIGAGWNFFKALPLMVPSRYRMMTSYNLSFILTKVDVLLFVGRGCSPIDSVFLSFYICYCHRYCGNINISTKIVLWVSLVIMWMDKMQSQPSSLTMKGPQFSFISLLSIAAFLCEVTWYSVGAERKQRRLVRVLFWDCSLELC